MLDKTTQDQKHFLAWVKSDHPISAYCVRIDYMYPPSDHGLMYRAMVTHIQSSTDWYLTLGAIRLFCSKKVAAELKPGMQLLILGAPPPGQGYLHRLAQTSNFAHIDLKDNQRGLGSRFIADLLFQWMKDQPTLALMKALVLGNKTELDGDLVQAYARSGLIHLLAVSGLHVNMLYQMVYVLGKGMGRFFCRRQLSLLISLLVIWWYGWLCGWPPPISRAVFMVTLGKIGILIGRPVGAIHTLFCTSFVMLVGKPCLLFSMSFQLSYVATLSILYLHPSINRLWRAPKRWAAGIWSCTTLSLAVQVGTLPLILYYFEQFAWCATFSNWLAMPCIFFILALSILFLLVGGIPGISHLVTCLLVKATHLLNQYITQVASFSWGCFQVLGVNAPRALFFYIILVNFYLFLHSKRIMYLAMLTLGVIWDSIGHVQEMRLWGKTCTLTFHNDVDEKLCFSFKYRKTFIQSNHPSLNFSDYIQPFEAATVARMYGKTVIGLKHIPLNWYNWKAPQIHVDYLLIDQSLLPDLVYLRKIFHIAKLIVYTDDLVTRFSSDKRVLSSFNGPVIWVKSRAVIQDSWVVSPLS